MNEFLISAALLTTCIQIRAWQNFNYSVSILKGPQFWLQYIGVATLPWKRHKVPQHTFSSWLDLNVAEIADESVPSLHCIAHNIITDQSMTDSCNNVHGFTTTTILHWHCHGSTIKAIFIGFQHCQTWIKHKLLPIFTAFARLHPDQSMMDYSAALL